MGDPSRVVTCAISTSELSTRSVGSKTAPLDRLSRDALGHDGRCSDYSAPSWKTPASAGRRQRNEKLVGTSQALDSATPVD